MKLMILFCDPLRLVNLLTFVVSHMRIQMMFSALVNNV